MKAVNHIIVKVHKRFEDELKIGDLTLWKDTTFSPEWNAVCYGEVVSAPERKDFDFELGHFYANVKDGDKLYFHYNVVIDPEYYLPHDGQDYFLVDYHMAIAVVRDGKLMPCGTYMLVEPMEEEVTYKILHVPEAYRKKELNRVKVVASNLEELQPGDIIEIDPVGKFENEIEGRKLFAIDNNNVYFAYN